MAVKSKNNILVGKKMFSAFTLIELLVVIAIIGILTTLAIISLQQARAKARDAKRIADIKQVQTALELYFNDNGAYPYADDIVDSISSGSIVYMINFPSSPKPADGLCSIAENDYVYSEIGVINSGYAIDFCLGGRVGGMVEGPKCATAFGLLNGYCYEQVDMGLMPVIDCSTAASIGDQCGGGKVFYKGANIYSGSGNILLVAAETDQSTGATWGCYGVALGTSGNPPRLNEIGSGKLNTQTILSQCHESGNAAHICNNLTLGGFEDWYLPSMYELDELKNQQAIVGGFSSAYYWSSTEVDDPVLGLTQARRINFGGFSLSAEKNHSNRVRAIRSINY